MWRALLGLVALGLAACAPPILEPADESAARAVFDDIRAGNIDALMARMAPDQSNDETRAAFEQLRRDYLPSAAPEKVERVSFNVHTFAGTSGASRRVATVHHYTYPDRLLVAQTRLVSFDGGPLLIEGFHVNVASTEQVAAAAAANAFTLEGKSVHQYAFLALVIASPLLMIWSCIAVIRTRGFRRKWLFAILSFVGLFQFTMNWTTGILTANLLQIVLIGFTIARGTSPADPWLLTVTMPLGALLGLLLSWAHRSARKIDERAAATEQF